MTTIHYPLLYYQLSDDAVLGLLVGTEHKVVGKDLRMVKSTLLDYLQKQYKKYREYEHIPIDQPKLCLLYTSPSPRDQRGSRMPSSA